VFEKYCHFQPNEMVADAKMNAKAKGLYCWNRKARRVIVCPGVQGEHDIVAADLLATEREVLGAAKFGSFGKPDGSTYVVDLANRVESKYISFAGTGKAISASEIRYGLSGIIFSGQHDHQMMDRMGRHMIDLSQWATRRPHSQRLRQHGPRVPIEVFLSRRRERPVLSVKIQQWITLFGRS
jgi:hypothetical protein